MQQKLFALGLSALALLWAAAPASAGVIREAGKGIGKGTTAVAQTTVSAAGTAASGVATMSKETPGAVKSGATGFAKGASTVTRAGYHGTKTAAKKVWKVMW